MQFYLAPMEGITTYIFRNAYAHYYGEIDKYFTPFLSNKKLCSRERNDILPENNKNISLVPQILSNNPDTFLAIARQIADYGYTSVNLNLGCPFGTVTAKKRGAGFLSVPQELDAFLDTIFTKCPLHISVKTRIGVTSTDEWEELLSIYKKYPMEELIIHPRLLGEYYKGSPHIEAFCQAANCLSFPLCYNGDITSQKSYAQLLAQFPDLKHVMLGRGIIQNPGLAKELRLGESKQDIPTFRAFHNEIYENYRRIMSGQAPVLFKMKDLWAFFVHYFTDAQREIKKIRKANHFSDYEIAVEHLLKQAEGQIS